MKTMKAMKNVKSDVNRDEHNAERFMGNADGLLFFQNEQEVENWCKQNNIKRRTFSKEDFQ